MTETRKLRVFLCHASQDKPIVRELYQRLLTEGWIDPWLDAEKLLPGQDWDLEIEKAVETADAVIVFLSTNSVTKEGYVQRELRKILDVSDEKPDGAIFLIPIRLDDCSIPKRLKKWQFVDYFPTDHHKSAYQRVIKALHFRRNTSFEQRGMESNGLLSEDDPSEARRKKKMQILGDYYTKGYSEELLGDESPVLEREQSPSLIKQEAGEQLRAQSARKNSSLFSALRRVLSLPKYIGRFVFDLTGRDTVQESSALILGWIVIVIFILMASGFVTFDMLQKIRDAYF